MIIEPKKRASFMKEDGKGGWNLTHVENITEDLKRIKEIKKTDGFSNDREFRHMASIPETLFAKVGPQIAPNGVVDRDRLLWWLDNDMDGQKCKTVEGSARHV